MSAQTPAIHPTSVTDEKYAVDDIEDVEESKQQADHRQVIVTEEDVSSHAHPHVFRRQSYWWKADSTSEHSNPKKD